MGTGVGWVGFLDLWGREEKCERKWRMIEIWLWWGIDLGRELMFRRVYEEFWGEVGGRRNG
jgi:hypothetical protein